MSQTGAGLAQCDQEKASSSFLLPWEGKTRVKHASRVSAFGELPRGVVFVSFGPKH